jgi:outer membrane protein assembly factor BamB
MKRTASVFILSLSVVLSASAGDWTQWRGSHRDGVAHDSPALIHELPSDGLKPLWLSEPIPGGNTGGWASPTVVANRVYLYSHSKVRRPDADKVKRKFPWLAPNKRGHLNAAQYAEYEVKRRNEDEAFANAYDFAETVYCLDRTSGKTLWKAVHKSVYTRFVHSSTLAAVDGQLFVLGAGRTAHCLDLQSGKWLWHTKIPGEFRDQYHASSFAVAEGVAVVMCGDLVGLEIKTGKLLWMGSEKKISGTHTSPTLFKTGDRTLVIANVDRKNTACVDPKTGKELWRVETSGGHATPLVIGDRMITYGATRRSGLRCFKLSAEKAEPLWTYNGTADSGGSPVVVADHVFVMGEYHMACVDMSTGKAKWTQVLDVDRPRYASLIAADGKIFYAWAAVMCFDASPTYKMLYDGKINEAGLMADLATHKRLLSYDQLAKDKGREKAEKVLRSKVSKKGPQTTNTLVIADGLLLVRTARGLACYDLRKAKP